MLHDAELLKTCNKNLNYYGFKMGPEETETTRVPIKVASRIYPGDDYRDARMRSRVLITEYFRKTKPEQDALNVGTLLAVLENTSLPQATQTTAATTSVAATTSGHPSNASAAPIISHAPSSIGYVPVQPTSGIYTAPPATYQSMMQPLPPQQCLPLPRATNFPHLVPARNKPAHP